MRDQGAGRLDETAKRYVGGTDRLAGPAREALVEVMDDAISQRQPAFGKAAHQMNATARRVGLQSKHLIGWARAEAQATADALDEVSCGWAVRVGARWGNGLGMRACHCPSVRDRPCIDGTRSG
ncbi:MAG: hypothetical protein KatS3mg060_0169 [Dehalococcoidia bacterium]|nr:MAG: hypothetical protein KatS3mg060_0169 [Dehalococcoidia bacterium]